MSSLPVYVIDGNLYDSLGAVRLQDVVMHSFCVKADPAKVQAWLDKTFAAPSSGAVRYKVIGDKVFLGIAEIGKITMVTPGAPSKGWTTETDVAIWILAEREDDGFLSLRWIPAYLFVDTGQALASGREVWGFPKQLARFDFSPQTSDPGAGRTFTVQGWVISPFGPDSPTRWATMFEARPVSAKPPARQGVLATLEDLARTVVDRLTDEFTTIAGKLNAALGAGSVTMAFLKQFPDAANPTTACYQAVVEADSKVTAVRGSGVTDDDYEVRITTFDTHPYLGELGISSDWQQVGQAIWMDFDFEQALGGEVWRAGGPA